jgi:hypothetical protein
MQSIKTSFIIKLDTSSFIKLKAIILNNTVEFERVAIREQDEAVVTTASRS